MLATEMVESAQTDIRSKWSSLRKSRLGLLYRGLAGGFPVLTILSLLAAFLALRWMFIQLGALPIDSFHCPVLIIEVVRRLPAHLAPTVLLCFVFGMMLRKRKRLPEEPKQERRTIKGFATLCALVLAWPYTTYDYNPYFTQWHVWDRLLLASCCVGIYFRSIFVIPFLLLLIPLAGHTAFPVGGHSWAAPDLAIHLLILFLAFRIVNRFSGKSREEYFYYLACCFIAIHYWASGYTKLRAGWFSQDHLEFLLPNSWANGWLPILSKESIIWWTQHLSPFGPALKFFTLFVECGSVLVLLHRRFSMLLLVLWISFHTGIFLMTGICFWPWVIIDAGLLLILWKKTSLQTTMMYSWRAALFSLIIIGTSSRWFGAVSLSWFDAKASYVYKFYGTGESGKTYHLPPSYFAPYDYQFTLTGFHYLSNHPTLDVVWGATSKETARRLAQATNGEEILEIEAEIGKISYSSNRKEAFEKFIQKFVSNVNVNPAQKVKMRPIRAPRILHTYGETNAYRGQEKITGIEVIQTLYFYNGSSLEEIERRRLLNIQIPQSR